MLERDAIKEEYTKLKTFIEEKAGKTLDWGNLEKIEESLEDTFQQDDSRAPSAEKSDSQPEDSRISLEESKREAVEE